MMLGQVKSELLKFDELNCFFIDCGFWPTNYLDHMGNIVISRDEYLDLLNKSVREVDIVKNWEDLFENWDIRLAVEKHFIKKP